MKTKEMKKTANLQARCEPELRNALDEFARIQRVDPSDLIRIGVSLYLDSLREAMRPKSRFGLLA